MATQKNLTAVLVLGLAIWAGCATDPGAGDDDALMGIDTDGDGDIDQDDGPQGGVGDPSNGGGEGTGNAEQPATPVEISSPVFPTTHPRIYLTPNRTRLTAALSSNSNAARRFKTNVDQWMGGADIWGFEAWTAALMSQLSGNTSYCTKAVATVEAQVVAAEAKIAVNQVAPVAADSYLHVGEMIGDLALVYDWCFNQVSSSQRTRWIRYANQAVWNVWNHTAAKWGSATIPWSGWSVNDSSNNYYYSFLRATMLLGLATKGEDSQADTWITQFRTTKLGNQLMPTFNADLVGGGSREGTGYGVAMRKLFELYHLWYSTTGENIALLTPHTRSSMLTALHQLVPTRDRVAPQGDLSRDSTAAFYDYHRDYLQELIQLFPTDQVAQRAKTQLAASSVPAMTASFMLAYDFLYDTSNVTARPIDGLNTTYHASGTAQLYSRSGWDTNATWVNLTAGPYTQSHAHQDQGSLMIYKGGWLAHDAVVHSHSGIFQDTTSHGLVRINNGGQPVRQVVGTNARMTALHQGTNYTYASADLTPAYNGNAAVQKVHREMVHLMPDVVVVFDRVQSASGTTQTWQLTTPTSPAISGAAATVTNAGHSLKIEKITGGTMSVTGMPSVSSDFSGGFRLDETMAGGDNRYLHVLSVDGAVSSTSAAGSTATPGVTVRLTNGTTATVTFNRDTAGATLVYNGVTTTLAAGVDRLPETR